MSIFSRILAKLGFGDKKAAAAPAPAPTATPGTAAPASVAPAAPKPISEVDVVAKLEKLASANSEKLNWKVSIVDLMKLLDLEVVWQHARNWRPSWARLPTKWATRRR